MAKLQDVNTYLKNFTNNFKYFRNIEVFLLSWANIIYYILWNLRKYCVCILSDIVKKNKGVIKQFEYATYTNKFRLTIAI